MKRRNQATEISPSHDGGMHARFRFTACLFRTSIVLMGVFFMLSPACARSGDYVADCVIDSGPCRMQVIDAQVELDITPKPVKAMEELLFVLSVRNIQYHQLILDLSMPGMQMGQNRIILSKREDGKYVGKGVIPRCPSGRRLWEASIDLPGAGTTRFRFNVTY